jgi:flavin-dependent dehydrogenase
VRAARALGFPFDPVAEREVRGFAISFRLGRRFSRRYAEPLFHGVMRARFDAFLTERAAAAGAEVHDGVTVRAVELGAVEVAVRTDRGVYRGRFLVGADGANSVVRRQLGLAPGVAEEVALEAELPADGARAGWADLAGLDLGTLASGYGWVFPKAEVLSVGVAAPQRLAAQLKPYYWRHARYHRLEALAERTPLVGHKLPLRRPGAPIVAGPALLVGDAAGLVDAFTGEGIFAAIRSGQLAAAAVRAALAAGRPDLADYEARIDAELMPELLEARRFLRIFNRFPHVFWRLLRDNDRFWRAFCRVLRGEKAYAAIRRKLGPVEPLLDRLVSAEP